MNFYVKLFLALFLSWNTGFAAPPDDVAIPVDGYAARVNKSVITVGQVLEALKPLEAQLSQVYSGRELQEKLEAAYEKILDSLIERKLIVDEFKSKGMSIPSTMVDRRVDEMVRLHFNNDKMALFDQLDKEGLTLSEWREEIGNQIIVSVMHERQVGDRIIIPPGNVREAYERDIEDYTISARVELWMIVLDSGNTDEEKVVNMRLAEQVRARLLKGEDFAELAGEVSIGIKSAEGGYWGWVEPKSRRQELADVLKRLDPGEISEVVEAGNRLYIMTVGGKKGEAIRSFEEVELEITEKLRREKAELLYEEWVRRLKNRAYVRKF